MSSSLNDTPVKDNLQLQQEFLRYLLDLTYFRRALEHNSSITIDTLVKLIGKCIIMHFRKYQFIYEQEQQKDSIFLIIHGKVGIFKPRKEEDRSVSDFFPVSLGNLSFVRNPLLKMKLQNLSHNSKHMKTVQTGETLGNYSLMFGLPYQESALAMEDCQIMIIDRHSYEEYFKEMEMQRVQRKYFQALTHPLFQNYQRNEVMSMILKGERLKFSEAEHAFSQDDFDQSLYLILGGQFSLQKSFVEGSMSRSQLNPDRSRHNSYQLFCCGTGSLVKEEELLKEYMFIGRRGHNQYSLVCASKTAKLLRLSKEVAETLYLQNFGFLGQESQKKQSLIDQRVVELKRQVNSVRKVQTKSQSKSQASLHSLRHSSENQSLHSQVLPKRSFSRNLQIGSQTPKLPRISVDRLQSVISQHSSAKILDTLDTEKETTMNNNSSIFKVKNYDPIFQGREKLSKQSEQFIKKRPAKQSSIQYLQSGEPGEKLFTEVSICDSAGKGSLVEGTTVSTLSIFHDTAYSKVYKSRKQLFKESLV